MVEIIAQRSDIEKEEVSFGFLAGQNQMKLRVKQHDRLG